MIYTIYIHSDCIIKHRNLTIKFLNATQTIKNLKMYLQQRNQTLFTIVSNDKYIFGVSNKRNFYFIVTKSSCFTVKLSTDQ